MQERLFAYYESPWVGQHTANQVLNHLGRENVSIETVFQQAGMIKLNLWISQEAIQKVKEWKETQ